ncbi:hypothetical protein [Paenibacillus pinihumi]|uniref:hypothetical protein n=1 Tax=Paenibacillus pinihumi TaxID=669462 RepID=UPI0003F869E8|nr:hypothetical protein [Paenibacillus pinihumi]
MNGMSYQPGFQSGNQSFNQQNQYQPAGYVQSQYRGQISTQSNAGPVISQLGYQANQQNYAGGQSYGAHNLQSGYSNYASAQTQYQPVLSHLGDQAGQDALHRSNYVAQQPYAQQSQQNFNNQYQSQPVIARFGGYSANSNNIGSSYNGGYGYQGGYQGNYQGGFQQAHAYTQQNPVLNATGANAQDGPVLAHVGYQAGNQHTGAQYGQGGINRF